MRNFFLLLVAVLIVAGGYGYQKSPKACRQLGFDMVNDTKAIFLSSSSTNSLLEPAPFASSPPPYSSASTPSQSAPSQPAPSPQAAVEPGSLLVNGDFSRGDSNWEGDGNVDPAVGRALVVPLKSDSWTMISQDFKGNQGTVDTITINFEASPDISASTNAADYSDVVNKIQFEDYKGYSNVTLPVGYFLFWIGDLTNHSSRYEMYPLKAGPAHMVTIQHAFPASAAFADKMVTLAFPPGTGKVIIRSVSVTSKS